MNTTTTRFAKYAGAGLAGIATSCALAAPALAMRPDPTPGGGGQNPGTTDSRVAQQSVQDRYLASLDHAAATATANNTRAVSSAGGVDWSALAAGFGGGAMLTGVVVLGATQLQRRRASLA